MSEQQNNPDELRQWHRWFASDLFNRTWELIDKPDRTPAEDDEMIAAAMGSRYHWGTVGQPINFATGDWQISRVYAVLGQGENALHFGQRCLALCKEHNLGAFDLAYAYEAIARAHALLDNPDDRDHHITLARATGQDIDDDEDRELLMSDLDQIEQISAAA